MAVGGAASEATADRSALRRRRRRTWSWAVPGGARCLRRCRCIGVRGRAGAGSGTNRYRQPARRRRPVGRGADVVLGIEESPGLRWGDLAAGSGRLPADALQRALPSVGAGRGRVAVLTFGRSSAAAVESATMDAVLASGRRAGRMTVVDVPRHPDPAADRALERADLAVVVTPADVRGCWAADRIRARIFDSGCRAGVVVRGPSPGGLGAGDLAGVLQLPLLARMRADPALPRDLEIGLALVAGSGRPLSRAAGRVLAAVDRSS